MADRIMLILHLGSLATDAARRGDDRAAVTLRETVEMLMLDGAELSRVDERRRNDRERKPARNPRIPRKSTESAESNDGSQGFSPTPPFPNSPKSLENTAREAADAVDSEYSAAVEQYTGMVAERMGALWPDVDAFVKRRDFANWRAWLKEVLASLTGGQAEPEDVAQVCRDDEALDHRIGSPKGFRTFVASAARERIHPPTEQPRVRGGVANRTYAAGRSALRDLP